jgi:hypothetical protein
LKGFCCDAAPPARPLSRQGRGRCPRTLGRNSPHASTAVGSSNPIRSGDLRPNRGGSVRSGVKANFVECPKPDIVTRKLRAGSVTALPKKEPILGAGRQRSGLQSYTDLNSLCYNSFTGQGQLLWVRVCPRNGDLAWCPWCPLTSEFGSTGLNTAM